MKTIALVGAPGSGKTLLKRAIMDKVAAGEPQCDHCPPGVIGVDHYAERVADRGDYEIGLDGGYMANIAIALERYNQERTVAHKMQPEIMVVCGTVIETAVYTAQNFERTLATKVDEEDKMQEAMRFQACTSMLAVMFMDMFKYDKAFYLPSPHQPDDERWVNYERNLQAGFQAFGAPVAPLVVENFTDLDDLTNKRLEKVFE